MPPQQDDLDALNAAIDRMRKHIPEQPYIQSIPQDEPRWHHRSREHANAWRKDAPFDLDERSDLQYQTFYYHEHGTNLIHLGVHSPLLQQDQTPNSDAAKSLTATPKLGPKKKISLADYKNQKSGTPKPAAEKEKLTNSASKVEKSDKHKHSSERDKLSGSSTRDFAKPDNTQLKRKRSPERTAPLDSPEPIRRRTEHNVDGERKGTQASRKPRAETPPPDRKRKQGDENKKKDSFQLPAPISPLPPPIPERLSPIGSGLPECLSPTLPANIVAELDRREERRRAQSDTSKSSSGQSGKAESKHDSVRSVVETATDEPKKRKRLQEEDSRSTKAAKVEDEAHHHSEAEVEGGVATADDTEDREDVEEKLSYIHIFKIPKARRQDTARLLRFPPRPSKHLKKKSEATARKIESVESSHKKEASKQPPRAAEKHRKPSRSPSPVRGPKSSLDNHESSLQPPFQSPPLPHKDARLATPSSKRPTSHAMSRIPSTDSHIPSPLAPTPNSTNSQPTSASTALKPPERHTALSASWQAEHDRLIALGRTLKQSAQRLLNSPAKWEQEHGMLTAIEALCCFMLSFHASDRSAQHQRNPAPYARASRTWGTMNALWMWTYGSSGKWPALRGLVAALGLVYTGKIFAWEERERRAEREREERGNVDEKRAETATMAVRHVGIISLGKGLGVREVRERWPGTWGRIMAGEGRKGEDRGVGEYEGEVSWPLSVQTPVVESVRTVVDMLGEWKSEKTWKATLKLTRS
ncbi:Hypothetical protein D9617_5g070910 [Elsinoe fawcettii]|nr:Hypothetical protein D9617_5g070910 [Elsinoe fawcettii]